MDTPEQPGSETNAPLAETKAPESETIEPSGEIKAPQGETDGVQEAPAGTSLADAPSGYINRRTPYVPAPHAYRLGDRVGLLGRIRDIHDKGNLSIEIEGTGGEGVPATAQYVHISEQVLHQTADMIYLTRERRLAEEGRDG
jgi:hypothetical protein